MLTCVFVEVHNCDALGSVFSNLPIPVLWVENSHVGLDWVIEGLRGHDGGETQEEKEG